MSTRRKKAPAGYKSQRKEPETVDQDAEWLASQQALLDGGAKPKPRRKKQPTMSKRSRQREALREKEDNAQEALARAEEEARLAQQEREAAEEEARARAAQIARAEALRQAEAANSGGAEEPGEESGYGDEDFEDYDDDDFDDDDDDDDEEASVDSPGGARSIAKAMQRENASATSQISRPAPAPAPPPVVSLLPTRDIVMIETKQATRTKVDKKALSRSRTRWRDLVSEGLITLSETDTETWERPPCTLWEVECALGTTGRQRRSVQTGEDNITMETQTERPTMKSAGVHAPDDLGLVASQNQPTGSGLVSQASKDSKKSTGASRLLIKHDRASLDAFLQRALPVVESMLPSALRIAAPPASTGSGGELSTCYATLPSPVAQLAARDAFYWRRTNAGGEDRSTVTVAYSTAQSLEVASDGAGMVCVWNAHDSREPTETLRCAGSATCCWMGELNESGAGVVVAGTEEGSLAVWDLGQPRCAHGQTSNERWPSYCTDSLVAENHPAPIVCVRRCPNADDSELAQAVALSLVGSGHSFAEEEEDNGTPHALSPVHTLIPVDLTPLALSSSFPYPLCRFRCEISG